MINTTLEQRLRKLHCQSPFARTFGATNQPRRRREPRGQRPFYAGYRTRKRLNGPYFMHDYRLTIARAGVKRVRILVRQNGLLGEPKPDRTNPHELVPLEQT